MWEDWLRGLWAAAWASDIKWTDAAIVLFTFGQVWIGMRQARIARDQAVIAERTRKIALDALGRPYVFFEFLGHNREEWRAGQDWMGFTFRFTNHGTGPAVIEAIYAKAILSYGPFDRDGRHGDENRPTFIKPFPPKERLLRHISWAADVSYAPDEPEGETRDWRNGSLLVLKAGETSRTFRTTLPYPPLKTAECESAWQISRQLHELTGEGGPVEPWLIGSVIYQSPFGAQYWTNFCLCAKPRGGAISWDESPYAERT